MRTRIAVVAGLCVTMAFGAVGCSQGTGSSNTASTSGATTATAAATNLAGQRLTEADISTTETAENTADGEHALQASGTESSYRNISVNKTGEADGDEADFYGENAAVFATDGATLSLSDVLVTSNGKHANGIFSYGTGTTVNVEHSLIKTSGNCSGGLMTTGGGTMNANDVTAETTGDSSAAIRSDRGGGTVNVTGGYFTTAGKGSPVVYSTADITVSKAYLESTSSQGVVVEGKNSVTLNDCELIANNVSDNSDKTDTHQAVMIYQSMSGDASTGESSFAMTGGTLTNRNGDVFFVNNTATQIALSEATITNEDASGVFLRAAAAGWGTEGSNGGKVNLTASKQVIAGDMLVDSVSTLNLHLADGSSFSGAINPSGQAGDVFVEVEAGSTWTLTGDSYIGSLSCAAGSIDTNGHKLYVGGVEYDGSSASSGTAYEIASASSTGGSGGAGAGGAGDPGAGGDAPDAGGAGSGKGDSGSHGGQQK